LLARLALSFGELEAQLLQHGHDQGHVRVALRRRLLGEHEVVRGGGHHHAFRAQDRDDLRRPHQEDAWCRAAAKRHAQVLVDLALLHERVQRSLLLVHRPLVVERLDVHQTEVAVLGHDLERAAHALLPEAAMQQLAVEARGGHVDDEPRLGHR